MYNFSRSSLEAKCTSQMRVAPPRSDYARLEWYASQSLNWLTSKLGEFSPLRSGRIEDFYLKAFAELTLVYAFLQQCEHPRLIDHLSTWRTFITGQCENPVYAQGPRKQPVIAFTYLVAYLMLRSIGYRSTYFEETLEHLTRRGYLRCVELVPYRVLDREYLLWKSGYVSSEPPWRRLYQATVLGQGRGPLCLDNEAAYSVTHTLFYITDFGNRTGPFSSEEIEFIGTVLECLLLHYWRVGNWDLVGELLISLNCLGLRNSVIYASAATAFERAWQSDGSVPAKREFADRQKPDRECQEKEEVKKFHDSYHTTLVGVLYCATAMNRILRIDGEESCPA